MQVDRGSWMPGPPENSMGGAQLRGPAPLPGQIIGLGSTPTGHEHHIKTGYLSATRAYKTSDPTTTNDAIVAGSRMYSFLQGLG
ncbi:hypothetical protein FRX31_018246 [Thalictrum thalictroides]|uniref:Uncharacterized protein n=1 Tax=Thalictrum thalictroides TaxID=46969 RepID=A0A7J6W467_THATH|nr:hypothetical protein FRX31_018246 [Thalictrum thalictroides]